MSMMPGWKDVVDAVQHLGYNLRLVKEPPKMGRYTYGEKVEYLAVVWGTVIMIFTTVPRQTVEIFVPANR